MTLVSPTVPNPGDEITAASIATPVEQLADAVNGNLDDANIANLSGSKLADSTVAETKLNIPWTDYTPTPTGFSSVPSGAKYRYRKIGKTVDVAWSMPNNGTSNATTFTIPLPSGLAASSSSMSQWQSIFPQPVNNGSASTTAPGIAAIGSGATEITLYRDLGGSAWTASGGKRAPSGYITYEVA